MAVDLSVFDRLKTKADFDREEEEFQLRKQVAALAATGSDPAAIKLANEIGKARAAGDTQRLNDLYTAAKSWDKGVVTDEFGRPVAMGGYGDAVGSIAGTKKAYEANAQNASDLQYDPLIAGGEAQQRLNQELQYSGPIKTQEKTAEIAATQVGELQKKADQAQSTVGLTDQARELLQSGKPTGSYVGAVGALGKRIIGRSDENTQANEALKVIAGNLTGNVPRFEGPQSDADRAYYIKMAGRVDDITVPAGDRLAALAEIDRLNAKYANVQTPAKAVLGKVNPSNIPMEAVKYLRENPQFKAQFDQKYGQGASSMVLGK